jgi:serine/threonine protein kinase
MQWTIYETLNEGGFGRVFKCREEAEQIDGAMKELISPTSDNLIRFQREIQILLTLDHQNIIRILDWNSAQPGKLDPWYVMEYMEGGSLRDLMMQMFSQDQNFRFSRKWTINQVILPVASALELAHSCGIFHRDLKPANLLFTDSKHQHIKVADWGIGKDVNRTSVAITYGGIGTPGYCSPEQWFANQDIDERTDIFSLGVIFYEMMTGILPPAFDNRGIRPPITPPSVYHYNRISNDLNNVILKMMDMNRLNRYQNIQALINTLHLIKNNENL